MEHQAKGLRILIAEDNIVNQKVAQRLLEKNGFVVEVANDGREAVEALQHSHYDLVLMDIQMPEMDGLEATVKIREIEKLKEYHTPVIALTANNSEGMKERCFDAGMDGFIAKPLEMEVFWEIFKNIFS
jgi:CheY-like chemotaxis protein